MKYHDVQRIDGDSDVTGGSVHIRIPSSRKAVGPCTLRSTMNKKREWIRLLALCVVAWREENETGDRITTFCTFESEFVTNVETVCFDEIGSEAGDR